MTPDALRNLHSACARAWRSASAEIGLSLSEFEYLAVIKDEESRMRIEDRHGQHLQDIVSALDVAKASVSAMIVKLERRGFVQRFHCKQDARAQHIILTEKGDAHLHKGIAVYQEIAKTLTEDAAL